MEDLFEKVIFRLKPEEINQVRVGWRKGVAMHVGGWEWVEAEREQSAPPFFLKRNYLRIGFLENSRVWKLQIPSKIGQVLGIVLFCLIVKRDFLSLAGWFRW